MDQALYRRDSQNPGRERGEESCRDHAGLRGGLPGNLGRNRGRERAHLQKAWRQQFLRHPLLERQRPGHDRDQPACAARAARLALTSDIVAPTRLILLVIPAELRQPCHWYLSGGERWIYFSASTSLCWWLLFSPF